jgi:hypothetical protein
VSFATPYESPAEFQWDVDSAPEQPRNCGPSSATKVAVFFRDDPSFGIQKTRLLGCQRVGTGTNLTEQRTMLERRGVPSSVYAWSPDDVRKALASGRRPFIIWMDLSAVPAAIQIEPFNGKHAMCALGLGRALCRVHNVVENGIWIMDPNFHRDVTVKTPNMPLPRERVFYPDHAWIDGMKAIGRWVVVPDKAKAAPPVPAPPPPAPAPPPKPVPAPIPKPPAPAPTRVTYVRNVRVVAQAGLAVRAHPTTTATAFAHLPYGTVKTTRQLEKAGGRYRVGTVIHDEWVSVVVNGRIGWIAFYWTRQ